MEAQVGERIADRYVVEAVLGTGGMAAVYRVLDERGGRRVALKRLQDTKPSRKEARRALFEREYYVLAELAHPRIIEVYDYGVEPAGAYYTMELLDGQDLRERGRLDWREACALLRDVASSLAILHSRRLLHRDVTPRNVRCTADGRAKLIDFGAMCGMGVQRKPVGTPPFVPPEALQQQALDGRADLYALGGVAYWVLTGRYAYPARSLTRLPEAWAHAPQPARERVPELPPELSELVMALLCLERAGRPASAAEVMHRLCAIADLPREEPLAVGQAYLVAPSLVGREPLVQSARRALEAARQGRGSALLIEGSPGLGRSRLLDACVLEAKLTGATVLRADASDASRGDYGIAQALGAQLLEAVPALARAAARPDRARLAWLVPGLGGGRPTVPPARLPLQIALRDWLLAVARQRPLALVVDDFEASDEPSAALLAALAHSCAGRGLCAIVALPPELSSPAAELLRELGTRLALEPLSLEQAEQVLGSVFGQAEGLAAIAVHLHALSAGWPRALMELAHDLVDRGVARYADGGWTFGQTLTAAELPESLPAARAARLDGLSPEARELAELLAIGDPARHPVSELTALAGGDGARSFRALDELVSAGLLYVAGDRFRFTHPCWSRLLAEKLHGARRRALHARLATVLEPRGDPCSSARHWLEAGEEERAIERLCALAGAREAGQAAGDPPPGAVALFERALAAAERLGHPQRTRLQLRLALVDLGCHVGAHTQIRRHLLWLGERLRRDAGLSDWDELAGAPPGARLKLALVRAQERWQAAGEVARSAAPDEALRLLARVCALAAASASAAADLALLEELPPLRPVASLAPSLALVEQIVAATRDAVAGRQLLAREGLEVALALFESPERAGLEPWLCEAAPRLLHGALGALDALGARPSALAHSESLQALPAHRAYGWRVRMAYEHMRGDPALARECRRRAELFELQAGQLARDPGLGLLSEVSALVLAEDREGLRQVIPRLQSHARLLPRTVPLLELARAESLRLAGNASGALEIVERALQVALPGRSGVWVPLAAARVRALAARLGDGEAAELGLADLELCRMHGLEPAPLYPAVIEALAWLGRLEQAGALHRQARAAFDAAGVEGIPRALLDEVGARIGLLRAEPGDYRACALRLADHCRRSGSPALRARLERLLRDAERAGLEAQPELVRAARAPAPAPQPSAPAPASAEVAAGALERLLEQSGASAGFLYLPRGGELVLAAAAPAADAPPGLAAELEAFVQRAREQRERAAAEIDASGARLHARVLLAPRGGETAVVGAAALLCAKPPRAAPEGARLRELATALLASPDLDPQSCLD